MIVVDSSVWIGHLRDRPSVAVQKLRAIESPGDILVGDLVLLEVLQGARDEAHAARIERNLRQFTLCRMLDDDLAVAAARNYRAMRRAGATVRKTIDIIIGTFCLEHGHVLLHEDSDFDLMQRHLGLAAA